MFFSGIFHFVKRDYFRSSDDTSSDYDSETEDHDIQKANDQKIQSTQNNNNGVSSSASTVTGVAIAGTVGNASVVTQALASIASLSLKKLGPVTKQPLSADRGFIQTESPSSKKSYKA